MQNTLLSLPPELLQFIALHLATTTPNLGPPAALLPLLSVCRSLYDLLGWGKNWPFWAQIDAAKFTSAYPSYTPYDGYPYDHPSTPTGGNIVRAAHALRTRCTALSILRTGEPSAPGAARALQIAYGMLIEDEWAGDKLDWTQLDIALGRDRGLSTGTSEDSGPGKNRRQLAWANARAFALRYVRERMYDGRFGDRDPEDFCREGLDEWRTEWAHPAWRVGWPRDTDGAAAALWVLWFFEGEDTLRAEPEPLRRHIMRLLLPMVVTPFRYASALAPPHHYTVPLLPSVHASAAFALDPQGITIPTHHGPYPLYPLGAPQTRQGPSPVRHHVLPHPHRSRSRLLCAPPARLLFFARMQIGARMGVPPHLPRDRAEAQARFVAAGGTGPPPVGPTQADIHEKNARPLVRFERSLPPASALHPLAPSAVDPEFDLDTTPARARIDERWAVHRWRARVCRGYETRPEPSSSSGAGSSHGATGMATSGGGAPPGRIGRVYPLGSFAGLWAGTMLMPSEPPYMALVGTPGGALPPSGLSQDEFVAAARPVYMRIREYWSFHPHTPAPPPPPDSTTADEGMRTGWLPPGTRVVGVGAGQVEVRVPTSASAAMRQAETPYLYHTPLDAHARAAEHPAHDTDECPECERGRERERWARGVAQAGSASGSGSVISSYSSGGGRENAELEKEEPSDSGSSHSMVSDSGSSSQEGVSSSEEHTSSDAPWPEWDAPAWAAHRFDEDDSWEGGCDGVQDVVFEGETDPQHGMAWHHYEYAGRVRPWDGLIGLIMRPRDRTLGLATFFISGHLVGRDTFEGTWQMAAQDVLAPSWGGSVCLARGEE